MLTVPANWLSAFKRQNRRPIVLCKISTSTTAFKRWVSGTKNRFVDAIIGLSSLKGLGQRLDKITRKMTVGALELEFADDGRLRKLTEVTVLKGKKISVHLGEENLIEADYDSLLLNGVVDAVIPDRGKITVTAADAFIFGVDDEVSRFQWPAHPLRLARNLFALVAPADTLQDATFDEKLYTDTSHFIVSRHVINDREQARFPWITIDDTHTPESAYKQALDLMSLLYGGLVPSERGSFRFFKYDRAATPVRHLTANDIADFKQLSGNDDPINDITINGRGPSGVVFPYYSNADLAAQAAFGWPSASGTIAKKYKRSIPDVNQAHPWLNSFCLGLIDVTLQPNYNATTTTMLVEWPGYFGFCGTRLEDGVGNEISPPTTPSQQTVHQISSTRPTYYYLTDHSGISETVKCTTPVQFLTGADLSPQAIAWEALTGPSGIGTKRFWRLAKFTIERGVLGSTARNWTNAASQRQLYVYDITLAVYLGQVLLDRAAYGIPEIEFRVPMRHHDLQLGDPLSLTTPIFLSFGVNGLGSNTVLEIVGKEPSYFGSNPGYRLRCARIRTGTAVPPAAVTVNPPDVPVASNNEFYWETPGGAIYLDAGGSPYYGPPHP